MARHMDHLWAYNILQKENDQLYRDAARSLGLSECTFWILYSLRDVTCTSDMTQGELCSLLCMPKQTVHSALDKLEQDGYIRRIAGSDLRVRHIRLTPHGRRLAERTVDRIIHAELNAFDDLTDSERSDFLMLFQKYTDSLTHHLSMLKHPPQEDS